MEEVRLDAKLVPWLQPEANLDVCLIHAEAPDTTHREVMFSRQKSAPPCTSHMSNFQSFSARQYGRITGRQGRHTVRRTQPPLDRWPVTVNLATHPGKGTAREQALSFASVCVFEENAAVFFTCPTKGPPSRATQQGHAHHGMTLRCSRGG